MDVRFCFNLGERVRCTRTCITGVVDGFVVYADGTLGVCIAYTDANGVMLQQWRQLATIESAA